MAGCDALSRAMIRTIFAEELVGAGGHITEQIEHWGVLYVRSTLPEVREVAPGDGIKAGVGLRVAEKAIEVRPYVLRLVCRNGAMLELTIGSETIQGVDRRPAVEVELELRETIRACCEQEHFLTAIESMTAMRRRGGGLAQILDHLTAMLGRREHMQTRAEVLTRFAAGDDQSPYGLLNAITAHARDERNQALRWQLEAAAGAMLTTQPKQPPWRRDERLVTTSTREPAGSRG